MLATSFRHRQDISILLVLSMLFTITLTTMTPPVDASFLRTAGSIAQTVFVNGGALVAGYMGGVLGIALGGGPVGMVAGGVAGFWLGKKALNWVTSSFANVAMVAGAVGGGLLVAGMGFPMLAVGVLGGAVLGRGIAALIKKLTGREPPVVNRAEVDRQHERAVEFLARRRVTQASSVIRPESKPVAAPAAVPKVDNAQQAYDKYLAAYKAYMEASQRGDARAARAAYANYKTYLRLYDTMLRGK